MALGSPIGSPTVGAYPTSSTQSGPQFLPGYLMGDVTSQVSIYQIDIFLEQNRCYFYIWKVWLYLV